MATLPKLIDNMRVCLGDTLKTIMPNYKQLSIATGYWDLPGTAELIDLLKDYESIRLLIGQEPMSFRYQQQLKLNFDEPDALFPSKDFKADLEENGKGNNRDQLQKTVELLVELIKANKLEVKVYKKSTLHAKTYIFGTKDSNDSIAILGSSNFTKAGLFSNTELNTTEQDYRVINFQPSNQTQENGYLSWFETLWSDPQCEEWTGEFRNVIQNSPVGNLTYGPYYSYIKTLMEVYPDEMLPPKELEKETSDVLYSFQNRNAGILINKLAKNGIAILADSVGLGKTVTAGAVIQHYLQQSDQKANILIIAPAALKQQWKDDLSNILGIDYLDGAYQIISEQDTNAINAVYDEYSKNWRRQKNIDLFVIDEAHNLRANSGTRHDAILNLLQQHPQSHILLLTATPINNSLMDIANIIQLASKGRMTSVNVSYQRPDGSTEHIDFFEALKRIQSAIRKAEKTGDDIQALLDKMKPTIHDGLMHYLVRSTRQGVEAEGGIIDKKTGVHRYFPKSQVTSINYKYGDKITDFVFNKIKTHIYDCFEGIDPTTLNLQLMAEFTQQTCHPLDFLNEGLVDPEKLHDRFDVDESIWEKEPLFLNDSVKNLVPNILQIIFTFGFTPYRPDVYKHDYYGKSMKEIAELKEIPFEERIQFTAHNVLQVTWLKRMESSAAALMYSVKNYEKRLAMFEKYLHKGYIVSLADASLLESDYGDGEDIDQAFADYDEYLKAKEEIIEKGGNPDILKKNGVEKVPADPKIYNIKQIELDLSREKKLISLLQEILTEAIKPENDTKAQHLHDEIKSTLAEGKYGKKVLVFSFFADTINYLKDNADQLFGDLCPDFLDHAGFISGQNSQVDKVVGLFSPHSKHHEFKPGETEINFLFSTDVLSEGQNLQDAGYLINYDLHWNPVRMIQRNGRINRLGSTYQEVKISNMKPMDELEMYLNLVHRLERKISTIRNTVGLDQGVLSAYDVNPIEFIEKYYNTGALPSDEDDLLASAGKHIVNFRKFLAENQPGSPIFEEVKDMPVGKWNYLPAVSKFSDKAIALIKVDGETSRSKQQFSNIFFVKMSKGDYGFDVATYIDSTTALDYIEAEPEDNERKIDRISLDRNKTRKTALAEAKRQAQNPDVAYQLKPAQLQALQLVASYLQKDDAPKVDLQGIIQRGVQTIDVRKELESVLRQINNDAKKTGSLTASTIQKFVMVFAKIKQTESEDKLVTNTEGVLYYAKQ